MWNEKLDVNTKKYVKKSKTKCVKIKKKLNLRTLGKPS